MRDRQALPINFTPDPRSKPSSRSPVLLWAIAYSLHVISDAIAFYELVSKKWEEYHILGALFKWDGTFCTQPLSIAEGGKGVIVPGCVHCRKLLYTNNQYLSHLAIDVLPEILRKFSGPSA